MILILGRNLNDYLSKFIGNNYHNSLEKAVKYKRTKTDTGKLVTY